jgi:hypothetical protein
VEKGKVKPNASPQVEKGEIKPHRFSTSGENKKLIETR